MTAGILGQKVSENAVRRLKPVHVGVHNYSSNGVEMKLKMQTSKAMTRGYKAIIELDHYGKTLNVVVDRDELIMMLNLEGK